MEGRKILKRLNFGLLLLSACASGNARLVAFNKENNTFQLRSYLDAPEEAFTNEAKLVCHGTPTLLGCEEVYVPQYGAARRLCTYRCVQ